MSDLVKSDEQRLPALRHGLTAKTVLIPGEDATVWEAFEGLFVDELQPVGAIEEMLAHRVAAAAWRLLRVERLEGALASTPIAEIEQLAGGDVAKQRASGWTLPDAHRYDGLAKLARHESALERAFFRSLSALRRLQEMRGAEFRPGVRVVRTRRLNAGRGRARRPR